MTRDGALGRARVVASYHLRAGTRAALRASAIGVAVVIFAVGSAPEPAYTFKTLVLGAVGLRPSPMARVMIALFALLLAGAAARRITLGVVTWMRSLPVSSRDSRRGAWLAVTVATLPLVLFGIVACVLVPTLYDAPLSLPRVLTLPALLLAAGAAALHVEHRTARLAALVAVMAHLWGTWIGLFVGMVALAVWDRTAGGVAPTSLAQRAPRRATPATWRSRRDVRARVGAATLAIRWSWRVVGSRAALEMLLAAAVPVAFATFVRANNPELSDAARALAVRIGTGVGVAVAASALAGPLLARRPPWPWLRTLPWSSTQRVLLDAVVVALPLLLIGMLALLVPAARGERLSATEPLTMIAIAGCAAASVAAALRAGAHRQTGAVGEAMLVSLVIALAVALVPMLALLAPVVAAAFILLGARRERRSADAVRWNELRHDVAGDVGWVARA